MTLRDCRTPRTPRPRRDLPVVRTIENALYLPHSAARGQPSALFDAARRFVPESVDYRGPGTTPSWQRTDWPRDWVSGLPPTVEEAPEETYLFLGGAHLHYGHFLVTTLPRFWPLLRGRPDAPILCYAPVDAAQWQPFRFAIDILARLGLGVREIHAFEAPMRLRRAVVPAPAFQEEAFAHTVFRDLCLAIGAGCYTPDEVDADARPAYLAKTRLSGGVRRFANEEAVTEILAREGVEILHPEAMSFAEQVRLFARRRVVAGSLGSALHTALFAPPGRRVVALSAGSRINPTFRLVDALCGNAVAYLHQPGTAEVEKEGFGSQQRLPDPRAAAEGLLRRMGAMATAPSRFGPGALAAWSRLSDRVGR
ncbi:glycosyltransferase family 61 protein [Methylobacterium nonmethylotrophicum]|uniref:Glycosyltransferase family 61 protein n=1 Tax=Methylobacterium nonmethylotrophicum TaxID=1141884 RepID=A0A4Z0NTC4_9HYPH|nr:glycosyltransferase 61 family protein [Methylobacterium nonmethylotrophicum]TGE00670.1 glycosyltransferase family 61 protein [Methylobacterium nonmethylotrophicum]